MANIDVTLNPDLCQTLRDEGEELEEKGHERSEDRADYEQKNCKLAAILHTYPCPSKQVALEWRNYA